MRKSKTTGTWKVTAIGERLGVSAQDVNGALIRLGYQRRIGPSAYEALKEDACVLRKGRGGAKWLEWRLTEELLEALREELTPASRKQVAELAQFFVELHGYGPKLAEAEAEIASLIVKLQKQLADRDSMIAAQLTRIRELEEDASATEAYLAAWRKACGEADRRVAELEASRDEAALPWNNDAPTGDPEGFGGSDF